MDGSAESSHPFTHAKALELAAHNSCSVGSDSWSELGISLKIQPITLEQAALELSPHPIFFFISIVCALVPGITASISVSVQSPKQAKPLSIIPHGSLIISSFVMAVCKSI